MKELKFKTSKGEFLVVDKNNNWHFGQKFNYYGENKFDAFNVVDVNKCFSYSKSLKLSEITEGQASEIVDEFKYHPLIIRKVFIDYFNEDFYIESAIESLHSLLKSKGITDLTNKYIFKL